MQELNNILLLINGYISGDWFVYYLLGTGLFFTIYLKFPQIRYFRHAVRIVSGKYDHPDDEGDTSHFQALATALSGTVGTGNIAGVALAVHLGGPAALFWMLVTAGLGMTTKFVEVTLSHKYREKTADGTMAGGPMYFMKNRLNMKGLGVLFAVATVLSSFGTGNLPQINSIANSVNATFGIDQMLTGAMLAVLLGMVIIGGIRRIAQVTSRLVPAMALIYFIGAFAVIFANAENIVPSFQAILGDIFTGTAATGGFLGSTLAYAFNRGVNRGLFSNEAGQGSAPIAHASARANEPVSEGMVALLEPFIDTIIICMVTGLVLLSSGVWNKKFENTFQKADIVVLQGSWSVEDSEQLNRLFRHFSGREDLTLYSGNLQVDNGLIESGFTVLHARSIAENVSVLKDGEPYSGPLEIRSGSVVDGVTLQGESLIHSAPLTAEAFKLG
ncbi:MAG: amino acid carrier protein, partial [Acidobacteriota bacterium]|nr:amino acid carrier protein [Acidobacteriota bacterium]